MDIYDDAERDSIRAVMLNYLTDSGLRQPKLYMAICLAERSTPETVGFSFKTFQRFLARKGRVGDEVVGTCARFAKGLHGRPDTFHALGEALHAMFNRPFPAGFDGVYAITSDDIVTHLVIRPPSPGFALATEERSQAGQIRRQYDGIIVSTGQDSYIAILKDRVMRTPRSVMMHDDSAVVYERCPPMHPGQARIHYEARFARLPDFAQTEPRLTVKPSMYAGPAMIPQSTAPDRPAIIDAVCATNIPRIEALANSPARDMTDPVTGMSALHLAVGFNQFEIVKILVEAGAKFFPDKEGRWPSTMAVICEVDEELMDYIAEEEERALREDEMI